MCRYAQKASATIVKMIDPDTIETRAKVLGSLKSQQSEADAQQKEERQYLRNLFDSTDVDNDGTLSLDEFRTCLSSNLESAQLQVGDN